jgi:hypothetical protein
LLFFFGDCTYVPIRTLPTVLMRSLQVYLDSSDFSVLSDYSKRTQEIITLERQLVNWRNAGLIEIRFAYPHLIEAAPVGAQHIEASRCRAQKIAELCQGNALAAQDKIFLAEIRNLIGESVKPDYIFMDDGDWLPDISDNVIGSDELFDHAKQIQKTVSEMHLNRTNTRKTLKQFITVDGKLRPPAKDILKKSIPETVAAICEKYPIDEETASKFSHNYLSGSSHVSVSDILSSSFRNLPNFIEWFARHYDKINPTVTWLRESGDATRRILMENRQAIESIYSTQRGLGVSNDAIAAMAKKNISSIINGLPRTLLPRLAKECGYSEFPAIDLRDLPEKTPSLFTAISVMGGIARKTLQPVENERPPKISDMGDVIHSLYIPHVDFFRTDRFAASVIKEINLPFSTIIVGNLLQLSEAINLRLAEKTKC